MEVLLPVLGVGRTNGGVYKERCGSIYVRGGSIRIFRSFYISGGVKL
jgi:hypothetical protein